MGDLEFERLVELGRIMSFRAGLTDTKTDSPALICAAISQGWDDYSSFLGISDQEKLEIKHNLLYVAILSRCR